MKSVQRYVAFCKIMEYGSFTRAAEALGYTQAAVSQMVASLENEFSLKLLIRTRGGVKLTPEGKQLYPFIMRTMAAGREMNEKAHEISGLNAGEVRIGIFPSISQHILPQVIKRFRTLYPEINFVLSQGDNKSIPQMLKSGAIDFAFVYPAAATGFETKVLAHEKILAVVPENHRLAGADTVLLEKFADDPLILMEEGGKFNTIFDSFQQIGKVPNVKYRIQDDATILAMVEAGLGITFLSSMALEHTTYKFRKILTMPSIERIIAVAYENPAFLSIASKRFINFLIENLREFMSDQYIEVADVDPIK